MALLIRADGTQTTVTPANGTDFKLSELQAFVGGYIEAVYLLDDRIMIVNEEGKLDGLPYNVEATRIALHVLHIFDTVSGDVVVMTRQEAGEEDVEA